MRRSVLGVVSICVLAACGPSKTGGGDANTGDDAGGNADANNQPHTLTGIIITPTNPIVELDLNVTGQQLFTATGQYLDNVPEDLTQQVTWSVANPAVGAMTGAQLDIPAFAAVAVEVSEITASYNGFDGIAQITVVAYRRTGPAQDFFFVLPYVDPAGPATKPLDFSTEIPSLDVFFLMDTTGSMLGEITNLQNSVSSTIIPQVQAEVPNTQFGAGAYMDFPVDTYGSLHGTDCGAGGSSDPDQPFLLLAGMTSTASIVQAAVGMMTVGGGPRGCGNDWPESGIEALYQVATGEGLSSPAPTNVPANMTGVGGVGFRNEVMPVVVAIGDAMLHGPGEVDTCGFGTDPNYYGAVATVAHSRAQAKTALGNICARVVGVASIDPGLPVGCTPQAVFEDFATTSGARVPPSAWDVPARPPGCAAGQCCTDFNGVGRAPDVDGLCPVVFRVDSAGNGLGAHIVTGIKMLTRYATFTVTSERQGVTTDINGNPLPAPHTTADFIRAVTPTGFMVPPAPPVIPDPTFDTTTFYGVTPGTTLQFDVNAFNDFVMQTQDAQIFRATIRVLAGGCTPLDEREVLILVPPSPIIVD
jgi:hypothetical protein